jgi:hypothetical protein
MTYHTPELLLVGAAQNLVLATSGPSKEPGVCIREDVPPELGEYDFADNW